MQKKQRVAAETVSLVAQRGGDLESLCLLLVFLMPCSKLLEFKIPVDRLISPMGENSIREMIRL